MIERAVPRWGYLAGRNLILAGDLQEAQRILFATHGQQADTRALTERVGEMLAVVHGPAPAAQPLNRKDKWPAFNGRVLMALHQSLRFGVSGYAVRSHSILTNLAKAGADVAVFTRLGYPNDAANFTETGFREDGTVDGINYRLLPSSGVPRYMLHADSDYINAYGERLAREAQAHGATVIHAASNYFNGLAAVSAGHRTGLPSVYEVRGLWYLSQSTKQPGFEESAGFRYMAMQERWAALSADFVVAISGALMNELHSWGVDERRLFLLPNCVDTSRFNPSSPSASLRRRWGIDNHVVIGFAGSILPYEGLDLLVRAVGSLVRAGKRVKLVVVGDGVARPALANLAREVAPPEAIHFVGRVPFADVQKYYDIFDICPFPRRDYEVCRLVPPLKPLEAMAMGKAVVVSDVPPLTEMVSADRGAQCAADDEASLTAVLQRLVDNRDLRQKLADAGRVWVNTERSWLAHAKRLMTFYAELSERQQHLES